MIKLTEDQWIEEYKPVQNPLVDDAPWDGCMFETYGEELEYVRTAFPDKIWTLVEAEGKQYIVEGFHYVNRLGYFITSKAAIPNEQYEIEIEDLTDPD